tara:strand:+ start:40 stop:828 length:789 start_codon:yes stop_codon:yes gene_type:complete
MFSALLVLPSAFSAFPTANISSSFSATMQQYCKGTFPGCTLAGANTTMGFAINAELQSKLLGPLSQLPLATNQQELFRWDLKMQYVWWVDVTAGASPSQRKIINCSKTASPTLSPKTIREGVLGYSYKTAPDGKAPCSFTSSTMGACEAWLFTSQFGCDGAMGTEPEQWQIRAAPTSSVLVSSPETLIIASMSNAINMPASCVGPSQPAHSYASVDYTMDWRLSTKDDFVVPSLCDSEAARTVTPTEFRALLHPVLRARARR